MTKLIKKHTNLQKSKYAKVEMFPALQFKILYYVDSVTLIKEKGDDYTFEYGKFIYKQTKKYLEAIGNIYKNKDLLK